MVLNRSSAVLEPICCPSCNSTGEHGNRDEGKQRYRCHNSDFGCIKEGDATLHRSLEQGDAFFTVEGIAVGVVQPQAAQPVAFGTAKLLAETSRLLFPSLRVCIVFSIDVELIGVAVD